MLKLHEPNLDGESREGRQEISQADLLRRKVEDAHIDVNKPFDQWSKKEKNSFEYLFGNFYSKIPGGLKTDKKFMKMMRFDMPVKEKYTQDHLYEMMNGPQDLRLSEKYLNGSERQFLENIKNALIRRGVDIKEFEDKIKKSGDGNLMEDKEKVIENLQAWINLKSLPAIFDLLDSGYTICDLTM